MEKDWGKTIHQHLKNQRDLRFSRNGQLSLGDLIDKIESLDGRSDSTDEEKEVQFDFGNFYPTKIHSWRGSYSELALNYTDPDQDWKPLK